MNNASEILGEWTDKGYFIQEDSDRSVAVCYKDGGRNVILAVFNQDMATQDTLQGVCDRHQSMLVNGATK